MALKLFGAALALIAFTGAARANVPPLISIEAAVSDEQGNRPGGSAPIEPELALPGANRRRRFKLQFADLADLLPWGLIVVDEQLHILYASRRALVALATRAGLSSRKGTLYTERAALDRTLRDLVRLAVSRDPAWANEGAVIGVPDKDGQLRYALRVVSSAENPVEPVAVIAISDLSSRSRIRRDSVTRLFCLSDREAEFAELFAIGCCVQEIAMHMHVAVNTARVHLRHVFHKTGCSSQVELARKFAALP